MIRPAALLAAVLAAPVGPAAALSCLAPDPVATYRTLDAQPEPYRVVAGRLTFDPAALPARVPGPDPNRTDPPVRVPARLEGLALDRDGFTHRWARDVALDAGCLGPWCPRLEPGPVVAFVAADGAIRLGPCGGDVFRTPEAADLARLERCARGDCLAP